MYGVWFNLYCPDSIFETIELKYLKNLLKLQYLSPKSWLFLLTTNEIHKGHFFTFLYRWRRHPVYISIVSVYLLVAESRHRKWCEAVEVEPGGCFFCVESSENSKEECKCHVVSEYSRQFEWQFSHDFVLFSLSLLLGSIQPFPIYGHDKGKLFVIVNNGLLLWFDQYLGSTRPQCLTSFLDSMYLFSWSWV